MKTPHNPSGVSIPAMVRDLDDATLRSGHALLDTQRSRLLARWLDQQLQRLEHRFRDYTTPQARRRALER